MRVKTSLHRDQNPRRGFGQSACPLRSVEITQTTVPFQSSEIHSYDVIATNLAHAAIGKLLKKKPF